MRLLSCTPALNSSSWRANSGMASDMSRSLLTMILFSACPETVLAVGHGHDAVGRQLVGALEIDRGVSCFVGLHGLEEQDLLEVAAHADAGNIDRDSTEDAPDHAALDSVLPFLAGHALHLGGHGRGHHAAAQTVRPKGIIGGIPVFVCTDRDQHQVIGTVIAAIEVDVGLEKGMKSFGFGLDGIASAGKAGKRVISLGTGRGRF